MSRSSGVGAIGVHGLGMSHGWLWIAGDVVDGCGCAIDLAWLLGLELELKFEQFDFLLLLDQSEFSF